MENTHESFFISRLMIWEYTGIGAVSKRSIRDFFMEGADVHRGFIIECSYLGVGSEW